jgi:hypothetical protein
MEWATQGVLLLNATLTVRGGAANSHDKCGWQTFTDTIIEYSLSLSLFLFLCAWLPLFYTTLHFGNGSIHAHTHVWCHRQLCLWHAR